MLQNTSTIPNFPSCPEDCKKTYQGWIPNTFLSLFYKETKTSPSATTTYVASSLHKLTSGCSSFRTEEESRREPETLSLQQSSKLIWGQPTAVLGGDGCSCEPGWDECATTHHCFVCSCLVYRVFQFASPLQLLFLRLGGLNNHTSRYKATCQNHQGFLTEFRDRIQRLFPRDPHEQKCQVMEMLWLLQKK